MRALYNWDQKEDQKKKKKKKKKKKTDVKVLEGLRGTIGGNSKEQEDVLLIIVQRLTVSITEISDKHVVHHHSRLHKRCPDPDQTLFSITFTQHEPSVRSLIQIEKRQRKMNKQLRDGHCNRILQERETCQGVDH
jgi:hypothetical protein